MEDFPSSSFKLEDLINISECGKRSNFINMKDNLNGEEMEYNYNFITKLIIMNHFLHFWKHY